MRVPKKVVAFCSGVWIMLEAIFKEARFSRLCRKGYDWSLIVPKHLCH
jgi:hypothetical protein